MQTGGCGRKTTSSFRYFDVVLVKWKLRLAKFRFWQVSVSFLPPVFHCSIQTSPTLHFVHLRVLKNLRNASPLDGVGQALLCSFHVVSPFRSFYMQLVTPNVAAIAVSTVMRMLRILLEVNELLL